VKFDNGIPYEKLSVTSDFRENWLSHSHIVLMDVNEFPPILLLFNDRSG
jgi:hypothetical protein